jgi:hypothetical protein
MDLCERKIRVIFVKAFRAPAMSEMFADEVNDAIPGLVDPNRTAGIAAQMWQFLGSHGSRLRKHRDIFKQMLIRLRTRELTQTVRGQSRVLSLF